MKIFIYELFWVKNAINCKYWSNSIDYRNIKVNWGKTSLDFSAWFFYFFLLNYLTGLKLEYFQTVWTIGHIFIWSFQNWYYFLKLIHRKLLKMALDTEDFGKKCIFYYHELYWSELLNGLPWWSMCMRDSWAKSSLVFKKNPRNFEYFENDDQFIEMG